MAASVPYRAEAPATVELPVGLAPPVDRRESFAPWFAEELRRDPRHAGTPVERWLHVIEDRGRTVEAPSVDASAMSDVTVLLVPGLFGDCLGAHSMPFADGADHPSGSRAIEAYGRFADLGLHTIRMVELPGRASSSANASRLVVDIARVGADPGVRAIVLVTYRPGTQYR